MSTILADLDVIAARQRQVEAENQRKINTLEDENVKLLRERGDIAKRIKSLQDLRVEQRKMLLKINKLNNVSEPVEDRSYSNPPEVVSASNLSTSVQPAIKSALRHDITRMSNAPSAEPSYKKAKNGHFDSLDADFIPFSTNNSNNTTSSNTTKGNGNSTYGENGRFNGHRNNDTGFQSGRSMPSVPSGQDDIARRSQEALYRRAQENTARRRLVDNPCSYFSQAGNCRNGNRCVMSHDVVPAHYCGEFNELGSCRRRDCRLRHELFEYTTPNVRTNK